MEHHPLTKKLVLGIFLLKYLTFNAKNRNILLQSTTSDIICSITRPFSLLTMLDSVEETLNALQKTSLFFLLIFIDYYVFNNTRIQFQITITKEREKRNVILVKKLSKDNNNNTKSITIYKKENTIHSHKTCN